MSEAESLKAQIREKYGAAARAAASGGSGCCTPAPATGDSGFSAPAGDVLPVVSSCCGDDKARQITADLYQVDEVQDLPAAAVLASLGCGNPTALAELHPGEVVLDLGSGGGIDVLLSARRVGPTGKAYGLDMTDDMLALARRNQAAAGVTNVEFVKGDIEAIPLPDASVDVIISNCVINLAADKDAVFREAFRVLKPGGRFAVSDVVFQGDMALVPDSLRRQIDAWAGCVAGALEERDYIARLEAAGFTGASVETTRIYDGIPLDCCGGGESALPAGVRLASGFVRARKPA